MPRHANDSIDNEEKVPACLVIGSAAYACHAYRAMNHYRHIHVIPPGYSLRRIVFGRVSLFVTGETG